MGRVVAPLRDPCVFEPGGNGQDGKTRRRVEWDESTESGASNLRWPNAREVSYASRVRSHFGQAIVVQGKCFLCRYFCIILGRQGWRDSEVLPHDPWSLATLVRWPSAKSSVPGTAEFHSTTRLDKDAWESSKKRVFQLEVAMVGNGFRTSLKESLVKAKRNVQEPSLSVQVKGAPEA